MSQPVPNLNRMHGLAYDRRGRFVCRFTVGMGKKLVGKRLTFRFMTRDTETAIAMRDGALAALRVLGLEVVRRPQRRDEPDAEHLPLMLPAPREATNLEDQP